MSLWQLALNNIRGQAIRYVAFFLSSTFSVMLFFMTAQFVYHPDVQGGYIYGGATSRIVLATCLVLIGMFAFFFVLYSTGAFLRSRNQEFGLLKLMGTTRSQLRRLVWAENTLISLAAVFAGVALGLLFSRLFLLGISRIIGVAEPIRFMVVPWALLITIAGFFLLFQFTTLVSARGIGARQIIDLLKEARKPREQPRANVFLATAGVLLILGSYGAALTLDMDLLVLAFVPVTFATVTGTFLLCREGSVMLLGLLKRNESSYLRGTRVITVSQLMFRMRDNSRLLATIASLSAVVLAGTGTFYSFNSLLTRNLNDRVTQQFALFEPATGLTPPLTAARAEEIIAAHSDVVPTIAASTRVYDLQLDGDWINVLSSSGVDNMRAQGLQVTRTDGPTITASVAGDSLVSTEVGNLQLRALATGNVTLTAVLLNDWYVVSDGDFAELASALGAPGTMLHYDWPESEAGRELALALEAAVTPGSASYLINNRYATAVSTRALFGLSLFAGLLVSLLFFIGAASLLYFKLFTELPDDRATYRRLSRIGMTWRETSRTVTTQLVTLFLLPFALGAVHALVALNALGTILVTDVTIYSLTVIGLFALIQGGYCLLTRWTYLRALKPA